MRLTEATVDRYGPLAGWQPSVSDGLTVLSGPNEAGKTLYLEALLRLMDPAVEDVLSPPPRVDEAPVGRVRLTYRDREVALTSEQPLSQETPIQPADLPTIFVVRDNDLALPDGPDYYTDLIEHLGESHTSAIEAITDALKVRGRLTDTRLDLSNQYDDAAETRAAAAELIDEIEAFLDEIDREGWDRLQTDRLAVARDLREVNRRLERQAAAEAVAEHERLTDTLATYREAAAALDAAPAVTRGEYEELRELSHEIERVESTVAEERERIATLEADLAELRADRETATNEHQRLERRSAAISEAADRLARYREVGTDEASLDRRRLLGQWTAGGGAVGAGLAAVAGAVSGAIPAWVLAGGLGVFGVVGAIVAMQATHAVADLEQQRQAALTAAQDAGLAVETIDEIGPAIETFRGELEQRSDRVVQLETEVEHVETNLREAEANRVEAEDRLATLEAERDERLRSVGVDDLTAFRQAVETREEHRQTRDMAAQRLVDALGAPDTEHWEETAAAWADEVDALVADVDLATVSADTFDPDQHEQLQERKRALTDRKQALVSNLETYDGRVETIRTRASRLQSTPFIDGEIALEGQSPAALVTLRDGLSELVTTIDGDADLSRKAIRIFEQLAAAEERRIASLFAPDGMASRAFAHITDDRYSQVAYDPESDQLVVHRADGRQLAPHNLSEGTRDQLYLASRLSLADQLLEGEPGFLLLDDPLVGADPARLRRGFETFQRLVDHGWQVLYLTAKAEVRTEMVDAFDLHHVQMDGAV